MKKATGDGRRDISDLLRSPDGFNRLMEAIGPARPRERLTGGVLRRYVLGVTRTFAPGEKSVLASPPLEYDFELDCVMVPENVAFRGSEAVLFFHHDEIVPDIWKPGSGSKMPASMVLSHDSADMQKRDLYRKHVYDKGEVFELGVFENAGAEPLIVRAAVMGIARTEDEPK